jgi:RimJ/RimL family protein N-acetyltransferase
MQVIRYSGVRLDPNNHLFAAQLETVCIKAIQEGSAIVEQAKSEPFFWFDHDKPKKPEQLIREMLWCGEIFFLKKDEKVIGYACFRNVVARRFAQLEVYICPEYRKTTALGYFKDILYAQAFSKFPDGLELVKLKAFPHPANEKSIKALKQAGFVQLCELPFEACLAGQLCSTLVMELYALEIQQIKGEIINARAKRSRKTDPVPKRNVRKQHSSRNGRKSSKLPEYIQQPTV